MRLSKSWRKAVRNFLIRWNYRCFYCGKELDIEGKYTDNFPTIEHITPLAKGGTNNLDNIVLTCFDCNIKKSRLQN